MKIKKLSEKIIDKIYTRQPNKKLGEYTLLTISTPSDQNFLLFNEEESAKNFIFNEINDYVFKYEKNINKYQTNGIAQYKNGYIFINYEEALDWAESDNSYQEKVGHYNIDTIYLYSKENIEPKYKFIIDTNKYNL